MRTRIITAVVAITCIFPFFWFSDPIGNTHLLNFLFPLLFAAISLVSVYEALRCLSLHKTFAVSVPLLAVGFAFPLLARVLYDARAAFVRAALLTALFAAVYLFGVLIFVYGKIPAGKIALAYMLSFYVTGANACVVLLRDTPGIGRFLFLIPFIFGWVTDTFAYFSGRLFGKHKLSPLVSPKKTVEGAIGGIIFCALTTVLYGFIIQKAFGAMPNYPVLIFGGLAISVVSQIGDLALSAIKREYGIKDFGKMLPGHGGLLDRFDSSMAVTVLVTVISAFFPLFTVA